MVAALVLPGCILSSDRINRAPKVVIEMPGEAIYRERLLSLRATVSDDRDQAATLNVTWISLPSQGDACLFVSDTDFRRGSTLVGSDVFEWKPTTLDKTCVCAQVVDHQGAKDQACVLLQAVNRTPVAEIKDTLGIASGVMRPLYSQVHLTAAGSPDPDGDPVQYEWKIEFQGSGAVTSSVVLFPCASLAASGVAAAAPNTDKCFAAKMPGTYTVSMRVADTVTVGGASSTTWSSWTTFTIPVNVDTPPCIQRTLPEARAQRILLSRSLDLGGNYETRVFQVLSVSDDGEPYPAGAGAKTAKLIWYVYDSTQPSPTWVRQLEEGPTFEVNQTRFPKATPGDTVRVRLEVRDELVDSTYTTWICPQTEDYCCAPAVACTAAGACLRWTTWTVQFQP